jgi:hypothetical protein
MPWADRMLMPGESSQETVYGPLFASICCRLCIPEPMFVEKPCLRVGDATW